MKRIRINKKDIHKLSELIGCFNAVMFSPETMRIVQGAPQDRRKYVDFAASQSSRQYLHYLQMYHKVLIQRNELLKTSMNQREDLENLSVWDQQLIEAGSEVIKRRVEFIKELENVVMPIHLEISKQKENAEIIYHSCLGDVACLSVAEIQEAFTRELHKVRKLEKIRGFTMVGPHRDDMKILSNNIDLNRFGSQGQQRTATLSLKLGELRLLHQETGEKPVLLLDDVMSELDDERRTLLLGVIKHTYQTIITSTNLNPFQRMDRSSLSLFKVRAGNVERCV
jgi:DNA replication and repair protein RecF